VGFWGWGSAPTPQTPIPNPQSPIPNPQYMYFIYKINQKKLLIKKIKNGREK